MACAPRINNLSSPISKLDGDVNKLRETLSKTGTQNNVVSDTIGKLDKASKDVSTTFDFFKKAIKLAELGAILLSGGLTVLLAFAPEIINWYNEVLHSGEAADKAKLSISSMTQALGGDEYTSAVKQINELKVNTDLAKQGFVDKKMY